MRFLGLQLGAQIDRHNPITRGLRHVIIPGLAGIQNIIYDLVDKRCYMRLTTGTNNNYLTLNRADQQIYSNLNIPCKWSLTGPQIQLAYERDFSIFVRYSIVPDAVTRPLVGVGTQASGRAWEAQGSGTTSGMGGQFGVWTGPGLNGYSCDDGILNQYISTFVFTWNGTSKRFRAYKGGKLGSNAIFTGTPSWAAMGGGAAVHTDWSFENTVDAGGNVADYLTHIYFWEAELQPVDVARLHRNPELIFNAQHTLFRAPDFRSIYLPTLSAIDALATADVAIINSMPIAVVKAIDPGVAGPLLQDGFTGADGTLLTGHTMDIGPGWTEIGGDGVLHATIQSNKASFPAAADYTTVVSEAGAADVVLRAFLTMTWATSNITQFVLRVSDINNNIVMGIGVGVGLFIGKREASSVTFLSMLDTFTLMSGVTYEFVMTAKGSNLSLSVNGTVLLTASSAFNSTQTKHGIRCYSGGVAVVIEDFMVQMAP